MTLQNKILTYVITLFIQILLLSNQVSANTGFNPTCTRVPLYPTGPSNIDRSNGGAACPIGNVNCDDYGDCGSIGTTDPSSVCYTDSCSDICTDFVVDTNTTISSNLTCDSVTIKNGATLTLDATLTINGNAIIENGGIITHTAVAVSLFNLQVGGILEVQPGGKIDTSGRGISTLGTGPSGAGASHGGYGASTSSKIPYGDVYNPITVGSHGYNTSLPGGGLVRMTVGTLINNGSILANGANNNGGRSLGSGGGININVNGEVSGTGVYQASGGAFYTSSGLNGGGGRIAIKYGSVSDLSLLKSKISAAGANDAGDGTIYLSNNTSGYDYLYIKGDGWSSMGNIFLSGGTSFSEVIVENSVLRQYIPTNITNLKIGNGGYLFLNEKMTVSGDAIVYNGGTITHDTGTGSSFDLNVPGTLDINPGGKIDASGRGISTLGTGPNGAGASYGGYGASTSSKIPYGDVYNPITVGSHGYNTSLPGGGLIKIAVGTLINNGGILANGANNNGGRSLGSGGGINIIVSGDASGTGIYQANGGAFYTWSGLNGGGGRIAISYTNSGDLDLFKSKASAVGPYDAGDGSIYLKDLTTGHDYLYIKGDTTSTMGTVFLSDATSFYEVIVENSILRQNIPTNITNLKINNLGYLVLNSKMTVSGLANIYNGGVITHDTGTGSSFDLNVSGTLDINPGGKIDTSGKGISTTGGGAVGVGASYGGYGAHSSSKIPYGDVYNPITVGSYGTNTSYPGGGLIKITVNTLINNGTIASNGLNSSTGNGLGSGGAINITVTGDASGTGVYQANGGANYTWGGVNGGGGRIAISYTNSGNLDLFKAKASAVGPYEAGDGSIYLKDLTTGHDYLYIKGDTTSTMGTVFLSDATSFYEVIVENSILRQNIPTNITNLKINNLGYLVLNSKMTVSGLANIYNGGVITHDTGTGSSFDLNVSGTLDINPGGKIDTSGKGNSATGAGAVGIGASYGGYGAHSSSKIPYGDVYNPITVGSYGTSGYYGGGLIKITVNTLINNGTIASNGLNSSTGNGLGSGGAINITVTGDASGTGVYQANGGANYTWGGVNGGGGRIAISYTNSGNLDLFKAKASAVGPYEAGDGSIYLKDLTTGHDYLYIKGDTPSTRGTIFLENATSFYEVIVENSILRQTIPTNITNLKINNLGYLFLDEKMTVSGDVHVYNGGYITHSPVAVSLFNLQIGGTLEVHPGGRIDTNGKGISSLAYGAVGVGASHGGYGAHSSSKVPYGDVYNPTTVGSYGTNTSYPGGGLIRMTVNNLINNGTICSNGIDSSTGNGLGSGGSINIIVNGDASGTGVYQAVGGANYTYGGVNGGGGRIAIRYTNSGNLDLLKTQSNASGPFEAGEGTIYLLDLSSGYDYLYIKGNGRSETGNIILENATVFGEIIVENAVLKQGLQTDIKNLKINNGGYLILNEKMNVLGDAHIYNGGYITHSPVAVSLFNLQVGGTVEVHTGGRIDTNGKGISSLAYGAVGVGASHGGYGAHVSSRIPYGDVYNPTAVGSYGTNTGYPGGGLIRMTAGNLINNGTICSNGIGNSTGNGLGSGGSINIIVTGDASGNGVYQAVGGANYTYGGVNGGGGRIAIRYKNSDNLDLLKTNSNASGPFEAGEGTIYLKDLTTGNDYLYVKGYGYSGRNTSVGTGSTDYYFNIIEVRDGSKLYKIGTEDIVSSSCITAGSPLGVIDTTINCSGQADFRYYDLSVSLKNYDLTKRKYEFLIDGPEGGANFVEAFTGVISGNGIIPTRIKITKLGTYNFKFNIYDGDLECSEIDKSASKSVQVKSN